jgi:hypothetical protein
VTAGTLTLGQAVVSDGGSSGGGYALLAASPSVGAADRDVLDRSPGASDFLHGEPAPGSFLSFFALPSGCWAVTHRFVSGFRRGSFNRVVAHTLVVPGEVLARSDQQPWLLIRRARFHPLHGEAPDRDLAGLAEVAGDPQVRELPDLEAVLAGEAREESLSLILEWRRELAAQWETPGLARRLGEVFAALESGRRVLLPQSPAYATLLALCWSLLPPADRLASPWTTHFAPGVRVLFRMANAIDLAAARNVHRNPAEWALIAGEGVGIGPPAGSAAERLVTAALGDESLVAAVLDGWRQQGFRLIGGEGGAAAKWLDWLLESPRLMVNGLPDAAAMAGFLRERPWIGPPERQEIAGATVLGLVRSGKAFAAAVAKVAAALDAVREPVPVDPGRWLARVEGSLDAGRWERAVATLAVSLRRGTEEAVDGDEIRLAAAKLLCRLQPPAAADTAPAGELRRELVLELAGRDSPPGRELLRLLGTDAGELEALIARLGGSPGDGRLAVEVIDGAWRAQAASGAINTALTSAILEVLGRMPEAVETLPAEAVAATLGALRQNPSRLVSALLAWSGKAYDAGLVELTRWFAAGDAAAAAVASAVAAGLVSPRGLRQAPGMGRLSLWVLAAVSLPLETWLPFALAGAGVLDAEVTEEAPRFVSLAAGRRLEAAQVAGCAQPVLQACEAAVGEARGGALGPCHGALLDLLRKGAAGDVRQALLLEARIVAMEVRCRLVDLAPACERLDRLAGELDAAPDVFGAAVEVVVMDDLADADAGTRIRALLDLLCGEDVLPTIKWALASALFGRALVSLDPAAARLLAELPARPVDGTVLLAAGERLGWEGDAAAAAVAAFVRAALRAGRPDAASAALRAASASAAHPGRPFAGLERRERNELESAIACAAVVRGGWRLSPFAGRAASGRRRRRGSR